MQVSMAGCVTEGLRARFEWWVVKSRARLMYPGAQKLLPELLCV